MGYSHWQKIDRNCAAIVASYVHTGQTFDHCSNDDAYIWEPHKHNHDVEAGRYAAAGTLRALPKVVPTSRSVRVALCIYGKWHALSLFGQCLVVGKYRYIVQAAWNMELLRGR